MGLFTGAQTLYVPLRRWVVNVRASYFDETREQIDGLWNALHYKTIGAMYPDDAFGSAVLSGVQAARKANGSEPRATACYVRQTSQAGDAIDKVRAANPEAVVLVGPSNTVAPIIRQAHAKGWKPLFLTVSFVGTDQLIQEAGQDAEGVVIKQVVPPYYLTDLKTSTGGRSRNAQLAAQFCELGRIRGRHGDGGRTEEGGQGANAGRADSCKRVDSRHGYRTGAAIKLKLDYSAKDHKGFDHVIPTVVRGGKAVPFTDWAMVAPK